MPTYDTYPAVDEDYNFPPEVRQAIADSSEILDSIDVAVPSYNISPRPPSVGTLLSQFQASDAWADALGGWHANTVDKVFGTQCWEITTDGIGGATSTNMEFDGLSGRPGPIDVTHGGDASIVGSRSILVKATVINPSSLGAGWTLGVDSGTTGFSKYLQYQAPSVNGRDADVEDYVFAGGSAFVPLTAATLGTGLALAAAGDTVTKTAHGVAAGTLVRLSSNTAGGVANAIDYYVVGVTTDTFQLATAVGGSAENITSDGTATVTTYIAAVVDRTSEKRLRQTVSDIGGVIGTGLALAAAGDTVTKTAHGLPNGATVFLSSNTATGVSNAVDYTVVGATANTFQLAALGGTTPINITADGTATVTRRVPPVTIRCHEMRLLDSAPRRWNPSGSGALLGGSKVDYVFHYDDCYLDTYTVAYPVWTSKKQIANISNIIDNVQKQNPGDVADGLHLEYAHLRIMHDLAGFGVDFHAGTGANHNAPYGTGLSVDELIADMRFGKRWQRAHNFEDEYLIWPLGVWDDTSRGVASLLWRGARSTATTPLTGPGIRPYSMAAKTITNDTTVAAVLAYADLCVASGLPCLLVGHHTEPVARPGLAVATTAWTDWQLSDFLDGMNARGYRSGRLADVFGGNGASAPRVAVPTERPVVYAGQTGGDLLLTIGDATNWVDVPGLSSALPLGNYDMVAYVEFEAEQTADLNLRWSLGSPLVCGGSWTQGGLTSNSTSSGGSVLKTAFDWNNTAPTAIGGAGAVGVVARTVCTPIGRIDVTTAGTIKLQARQGASGGTIPVKIRNSWVEFRPRP